METVKVTGEMIRDLRNRHHLTQKQLASSLYGVRWQNITEWETGRRNCPSIVWWAMKLTWDKEDLWEGE